MNCCNFHNTGREQYEKILLIDSLAPSGVSVLAFASSGKRVRIGSKSLHFSSTQILLAMDFLQTSGPEAISSSRTQLFFSYTSYS